MRYLGSQSNGDDLVTKEYVDGVYKKCFGVCETASGTAAKVVTVTSGAFSLSPGLRLSVRFANANTANTPTLNVNNTGANYIYYKGIKAETTTPIVESLKGIVDFIWSGTEWHMMDVNIDDIDLQELVGDDIRY